MVKIWPASVWVKRHHRKENLIISSFIFFTNVNQHCSFNQELLIPHLFWDIIMVILLSNISLARPGRECRSDGAREPSCVCRAKCPDHWKPVSSLEFWIMPWMFFSHISDTTLVPILDNNNCLITMQCFNYLQRQNAHLTLDNELQRWRD